MPCWLLTGGHCWHFDKVCFRAPFIFSDLKSVEGYQMSAQMRKAVWLFCTLIGITEIVNADDIASLCNSNEQTVWSCEAKTKIYSLCASKVMTSTTGFLQYRAGTKTKISFQFPDKPIHPKSKFEYTTLAHGAAIWFSNGGYTYSLNEDIRGSDDISVDNKSGKTVAVIECEASTQSLTLNTTMDLMWEAGISLAQ